LLRRRFLEHLTGGKLAVAEACVQVFHFAQTVFAGYALQIVFLNPAQLNAQTARLLFEISLSDFDRPFALALVDDVFDFVFRARSLDYL
jgi:hypothetical protein